LNLTKNKVSVIIPVYNSEEFLIKSIESVLNQTYKNLEIIAIDDGSTDNSLNILQQYSDTITVFSQTNRGLASALNAGIKQMQGTWFKWFSPDDILYPYAIETLVDEAKKFPENTIVYSNWELIDENENVIRTFNETNYNSLNSFDFNVRLLDGQQINVNTTLIPASIFKKGCSIQEIKDPVAIDYDFFLRVGLLYDVNFHLIPKILVKYRIHKEQLSHKNITKTLSYIEELRSEILSNLDDSDKKKYLTALKKYQKEKPLRRKSLEKGLKLFSMVLPHQVTDKLLVFYLNKIRRSR